jgi:diaminopimelate epimerase
VHHNGDDRVLRPVHWPSLYCERPQEPRHAPINLSAAALPRCRHVGRLRPEGPAGAAAGQARRRIEQAETASTGLGSHNASPGSQQRSACQRQYTGLTRNAMQLQFSKMHGIGNDFVVLDCRHRDFPLAAMQISALADRHTGVGFDQLLSVEPARDPSCSFYYGIWNADGSPSGQCGNGVRCVAAWLHRAGVVAIGDTLRLESPSGSVTVRLLATDRVAVDMGEPIFDPPRIPFDAPHATDRYALDVDSHMLEIGAVSMGNPHAVVVVDHLPTRAMPLLGPALTGHARFREGANAGFVQKLTRQHLRLHVHERGVGWTRACGTGACAAAAVLHQRGEVDDRVQVELPGGTLQIDWSGPGHTLWMTGPAAFAFEGVWPVPTLAT